MPDAVTDECRDGCCDWCCHRARFAAARRARSRPRRPDAALGHHDDSSDPRRLRAGRMPPGAVPLTVKKNKKKQPYHPPYHPLYHPLYPCTGPVRPPPTVPLTGNRPPHHSIAVQPTVPLVTPYPRMPPAPPRRRRAGHPLHRARQFRHDLLSIIYLDRYVYFRIS